MFTSDCWLQLTCIKSESLVIIDQRYNIEFVLRSCIERQLDYKSWLCPKSLF